MMHVWRSRSTSTDSPVHLAKRFFAYFKDRKNWKQEHGDILSSHIYQDWLKNSHALQHLHVNKWGHCLSVSYY